MDNDVFRWGLDSCWCKPYDGVKEGSSPDDFARLCKPALARYFRENGCPGFDQGRAMLDAWCVGEGQLEFEGESYAQISARCDGLEQSYAGTRQATLAEYVARAIKDLAFEAQTGGSLHGDAGLLLAERICVEVVRDTLIAKLDETKVMETFLAKSDHSLERAQDALYDWQEKASAALPASLASIAQKLAADPSGKTVTAREVRAPKYSTAEILGNWGRLDVLEPADADVEVKVS